MIRIVFTFVILLSSCVLRAQDDSFASSTISNTIFARIQGKSYNSGCPVKRTDLRYLTLAYYDEKGISHKGEMICHKSIAEDLLSIFRELYHAHYPIHHIGLVDEYDASDEKSMEANNTSCFNYRRTSSGGTSLHARGLAIDLNPLWNPCIHLKGKNRGKIEPSNATRTHKIDTSDLAYKLFVKHGFTWGGSWRTLKDYQHFEKKK